MSFISNIGNAIRKRVGQIGHIVKRVGSFVGKHHATIATGLQGLAHLAGNDKLQAFANGVSQASTAYTALQNYHAGTHIRPPTVVTGTPVGYGTPMT